MSDLDNQLNRLFRAAATGDFRDDERPPLGFASRVFAECRANRGDDADSAFASLCRRAILLSYGIVVAFVILNIESLQSFRDSNAWHAANVRLIDSALQLPDR